VYFIYILIFRRVIVFESAKKKRKQKKIFWHTDGFNMKKFRWVANRIGRRRERESERDGI
jgi:hypothetical protein